MEKQRKQAIATFVARRLEEGDPVYTRHFEDSAEMIRRFFTLSDDLLIADPTNFAGELELTAEIGRFITGPPVSADDLKTLLSLTTKLNSGDVGKALTLYLQLLDHERFPWVRQGRKPSDAERNAAVVATACVRAVERARTSRRTAEQQRQENAAAELLEEAKLRRVEVVRNPDNDLPIASFKKGVKFETKQCDILVRLHDGRFLAIECKSSNSAVNSIKRLNDVADKQTVWNRERGKKVVTAAVIAGVYNLSDLETAQRKDIYLFWEHDLKPLAKYVESTKQS